MYLYSIAFDPSRCFKAYCTSNKHGSIALHRNSSIATKPLKAERIFNMSIADCCHGLFECIRSLFRSFFVFFHYIWYLVRRPSMSKDDLKVSLLLFLLYPALLWLFLNVFHGFCGMEVYAKKLEAVQACKGVYFWFCFLMRTYKLAVIHVHGVEKQGSDRNLGRVEQGSRGLKCRTWFHLSQEMALVGWIILLLLMCLPVLAFWSMFASIVISCGNILMLIRRLWRTAQTRESGVSTKSTEAVEEEMQDFLSNYDDLDAGL